MYDENHYNVHMAAEARRPWRHLWQGSSPSMGTLLWLESSHADKI